MDQHRARPLTRRSLAAGLAAASGAVLLPLPAAAEEPEVEAALAASPGPLDPAQRADVRSAARGLAKELAKTRRIEVPNDVDPAFVFVPNGGPK